MKALPKRKGNLFRGNGRVVLNRGLNESPSEKEGKFGRERGREGGSPAASMKALPKRKGNPAAPHARAAALPCLNESPSEKEGKCAGFIPEGDAKGPQ